MGKRIHRRKHFHEIAPVPIGAKEHYAIISQFHGGAHKHCTVTVYDTEDQKLISMNAKLKGSLKPKQTKSQLVPGLFVRISYGEISLVYKPADASYIIPQAIRQALLCAVSADQGQTEEIQFDIEEQPNRLLMPLSDSVSSADELEPVEDFGEGLLDGAFM